MMLLHNDQIKIEYDEDLQGYYVAWNPVAAVGMGETEKKALEELRQAAHCGVETMVNLKMAEINDREGEKDGRQSHAKRRGNLGIGPGA